MRARWATGAAVVLALLAGCGGDDDTAASPTTLLPPRGPATDAPTTTTTVGVDEVPDEITVDYVQRVMDALDESWGAMFRQYQADGGPTVDNLAWLAELYTDPAYSQMEFGLGQEAADDFQGAVEEPGQPRTQVESIISADQTCVFFAVNRSFGEVLTGVPEQRPTSWIALRDREAAPAERNPTPWKVAIDGTDDAGNQPENPCN
jgi:hypothetical protein